MSGAYTRLDAKREGADFAGVDAVFAAGEAANLCHDNLLQVMRCRPMRPRQAVDQAGGGRSRTRRAAAQRRTAKAGLLASRGRRGNRAGEEGRRRRCGTGGPRQTRRERGPFRAAVEMREVWHRADDARQSAPDRKSEHTSELQTLMSTPY